MSQGRTSSEAWQEWDSGSLLSPHWYFPGSKESPIVSCVMSSDSTPMEEEKGPHYWKWAVQASLWSWECRFLLAPTWKKRFCLWHCPVRKVDELQPSRSGSLLLPISECCQNAVMHFSHAFLVYWSAQLLSFLSRPSHFWYFNYRKKALFFTGVAVCLLAH